MDSKDSNTYLGPKMDYRRQSILDREFIHSVPIKYMEKMTDVSDILLPQERDAQSIRVNLPGWMMVYSDTQTVQRWLRQSVD